MPEKRDNVLAQVGKYMSLAFVIPGATLAGYIIGFLLDKLFGTTFLRIVFLFIGIAAGFLELFRTLQKDLKDSER
jgi:F0F1-type ATP synthase assembly protein I